MRIAVDAMGGDNAPGEIVAGAVRAAAENGAEVILCGRRGDILPQLERHSYPKDKVQIEDCPDVITNNDEPLRAVRSKKDSSMIRAMALVKDKAADAVVSAGNTGALIASASLMLGRLGGVQRPALTPALPTDKGFSVLLDAGANSECRPDYLLQFGVMGSFYMQNVFDIKRPRVALVNIGEEARKGNELVRGAYELLSSSGLNFIGNIEARRIPYGDADVIVTDGFTGNVILKLTEGLGYVMYNNIKGVFMSGIMGKLAAMLVLKGLKDFKKKMDYTEYGGAPLLGVDGIVIKAHGPSNATAFFNAIRQAKKFYDTNVLSAIREQLKSSAER